MSDLLATLEATWGHTRFRAKQEEIIRAMLDGRDVAAVMPTGGGKSLCYQFPPVHTGKLCVVISPLIALMADQAAHLEAQGIASAALHSNVPWEAQRAAWQAAESGRLRLLYLSPERLAREDTFERLGRLQVAWFAIDEAHCISDWGHEFRPEYRQLGTIRERFPDSAIAAFTASATKRVRQDIVTQLKLRDPGKFILSFHRSNLAYRVEVTDSKNQYRVLRAALERHRGESVIVYVGTTRGVEETAERLGKDGFGATAYHGKMAAEQRLQNQERWMRNDTPIMVSTLAFGLGINKPATRAVIHLSLPKSLEQYYQEAGRAGRDGQEADCLMLWQRKDLGLIAHFIDELDDEGEKRRAWQRYREVKHYGEGHECRARVLCRHFGEEPKWEACEKCDVCSGRPEWLEAALAPAPARRLRKSAMSPVGEGGELGMRLRVWRKELAMRRKVPAFVIFGDAVIEQLAAVEPVSLEELLQIKGLGAKKVADYGTALLEVLTAVKRDC